MTSVDWTLTEPTPQNQTSICQTERCLCSKKPSSSKLVSLRGLFLLVTLLSSGCKQRWVLLSFSLQWHKHSGNQGWNLQCLKKPLFPDRLLSMCPQCSSTWAFLVPCVLALPSHTFADPWCSLWCRHLASSLSAHLSLGWDLCSLCMENTEWCLIIQQKWGLGAGFDKRKHCACACLTPA